MTRDRQHDRYDEAGAFGGPPPDATYRETRTREVAARGDLLWQVVSGIGGSNGWYAANPFWRARAGIDRLLGGPGMRGRPELLRPSGVVDFWRVVDIVESERLLLRAEMRMPGTPWLELSVSQISERPPRSLLTQQVWFEPSNVLGHAQWWAELIGHKIVFSRMLEGIAREAEDRSA